MAWPWLGEADPVESFRTNHWEKFQTWQKAFQSPTNNTEISWRFAQACFEWADFASTDDQREQIANLGIAASRAAVSASPTNGPAHYFLALNLGQLARGRAVSALKIVREMEAEFKSAIRLDPHFDHGGPDRSLGYLYLEAPGWPVSLGSRAKARTHLEKALQLEPDFPENHLLLMEALVKWSERERLENRVQIYRKLLPKAREAWHGADWEESWLDWDRRWAAVQSALKPQTSSGARR